MVIICDLPLALNNTGLACHFYAPVSLQLEEELHLLNSDILHMGCKNLMQLYRLDTNWGDVALQKKTWGYWQDKSEREPAEQCPRLMAYCAELGNTSQQTEN